MTRISILTLLCLSLATIALAQATENALYSFTGGNDGAWPQAGLAMDAQGNLYGTTNIFGPNGYGTVFMLARSGGGWTKSTLHGFCVDRTCRDGAYPLAGVVVDAAGNLYGTTSQGGGPQGWGTVYKLSPSGGSWTFTRLRNFSHPDSYPMAKVTLDKAGRLFGTTAGNPVSGGLGTVFELVPNQSGTWNHRNLHTFEGVGDGSLPDTAVVIDNAHNLYGMTIGDPDGGLYQISSNHDGTWSLKIIAPLCGRGDLAIDAAGNLYGSNGSFIFQLSRTNSNWTQTILHTFAPGEGGGQNGLTLDAAGNLYGTSRTEGLGTCANAAGCGSVFRLTPNHGSWTFSTLYQFRGGADGGNPVGNVVVDQAGNVYGATNYGGDLSDCSLGCGVVYQITQ